jgi:hypothetical protein
MCSLNIYDKNKNYMPILKIYFKMVISYSKVKNMSDIQRRSLKFGLKFG